MSVLRKAIAVLIALRGLTNLGKPFREGSRFVVLGRLRDGIATSVAAPLVGIAIVVYAWGLWRGRPWARLPAVVFAVWATLNVVLFPLFEPLPASLPRWSYALFAIPGIVGPWLAVWLLRRPDAQDQPPTMVARRA